MDDKDQHEQHVVSPVLWTCDDGSGEPSYWDISVPPKNSLFWSLTMSYFVLAHSEKDLNLLDRLTGEIGEVEDTVKTLNGKSGIIQKEKIMERWIEFFNPFKIRHKIFHEKEIRLYNQVLSNRIKSASKSYNESGFEGKLKAASKLLGCTIRVYNVGENCQREYSESSNPSHSITLLRHYNANNKPIRVVFHFTLTTENGNSFQLDALKHWLLKAEISVDAYQKLESEILPCQGEGVLRFLIENNLRHVIAKIYSSPYIVRGLADAGFDACLVPRLHSNAHFKTDSKTGRPSNLCYALLQKDPECMRILLPYAYNCQHLAFDKSIRNPDSDVLAILEELKSILDTDKSMMSSYNFDEDAKNLCSLRLEYYTEFLRYLIELTNKLKAKGEKCPRRKIIIYLEGYLAYFHYKAKNDIFLNYLNFYEHYQNIDHLTLTGFFSNFNQLKSSSKTEQESNFSDFEWKIFTYMLALRYLPLNSQVKRFDDEEACTVDSGIVGGNIIWQHIPFSLRKALKKGIEDFISNFGDIDKVLGNDNSLSSMKCAILDELLLIRLSKYVSAVSEINPRHMSRKDILCIERTLQVIGESVKINVECVTSFFLSICLPENYYQVLKQVRNYLSHYKSNCIYGRSKLRLDASFYKGLREEITIMWEWFKVIRIFLSHRIKNALITDYLSNTDIPCKETEAIENEIKVLKNHELKELKPHKQKLNIILLKAMENFRNRTEELKDMCSELENRRPRERYISKIHFSQFVQNIVQVIEHGIEIITESNAAFNHFLEPIKKLRQSEISSWDQVCQCFENISLDWKKRVCLGFPVGIDLLHTEIFVPEITGAKQFTDDEQRKIRVAAENAFEESIKAHTKLQNLLQKHSCTDSSTCGLRDKAYLDREVDTDNDEKKCEKEEQSLLQKLLIKEEKVKNIIEDLRKGNCRPVIKYFKSYKHPGKENILEEIDDILKNKSMKTGHAQKILLKIAFQESVEKKVYESATLPEDLNKNLASFMEQKATYFLDVIQEFKRILIDDDWHVRSICKLGKGQAVKHYGRGLMRRKFMNETRVRAAVEMGLLDCLNLLQKSGLEEEESFKRLFEKSSGLFTGINLRHMMAHNYAACETIGEILDEADFPSEIMDKVLEFVDDIPIVKSLIRLFKVSGKVEKESFKNCIRDMCADKTISKIGCFKGSIERFQSNWEKYIALLPFSG